MRVYQEVQDYNQCRKPVFQGLVQPGESEQTLNGFQLNKHRKVDWHQQFERACTAYEKNQVLVLVDDRQTETLDEVITLRRETNISFLKLVPLVGG